MVKKIQGDISKITADVIIDSDNTQLKHSGGVAFAISQAAGGTVQLECNEIGVVPINEFIPTHAGLLKAHMILHIPTVDYPNRRTITYAELEDVFKRALHFSKEKMYKTVATPLLGAGVAGLDKQKVGSILEKVANQFPELEVSIISH
jgi:O-acetyl-ADP-ribose deacetylase